MTSDVSTNLSKSKISGSLVTGILLSVLGIAAIVLPFISTVVTETWVALILISAGAAKITYAFQTRTQGGFVWKLLLGVLYVATGVLLFAAPKTGILTLTLLLGSFLLTEGVFELILAFRLRPQPKWGSVLVNGIITLILGGMIWFQWPYDAPWVLGTLIGASVLSTGISRILLSLKGQPEIAASKPSEPSEPAASV